MNPNIIQFQKQYGTEEDMLSAMYQFWMHPDVRDRPSSVGDSDFDREFSEKGAAFLPVGVPEPVFCAFFSHAPIRQIELNLHFNRYEDLVLIRAVFYKQTIQIITFKKNEPLMEQIKKDLDAFHKAPKYPSRCFHTMEWAENELGMSSPDKAVPLLAQALLAMPETQSCLMAASRNDKMLHPYTPAEQDIRFLVAYNEKTQALVVFGVSFDDFAANINVDLAAPFRKEP